MGQTVMKDQSDNGFERVKREAAGRWPSIIANLYPAFAPAMAIPGVTRIPCPLHGTGKGKHGDGFRFYKDFAQTGGGICNTCGGASNGIDLIAKIEGCQPHEALSMLERYLGIDKAGSGSNPAREPRNVIPLPVATVVQSDEEIRKRDELIAGLWKGATPLTQPGGNLGRAYLKSRGIIRDDYLDLQVNLRLHPDLYYASHSEQKRRLPGIVAHFTDEANQLRGLHRTYLDPRQPKKAAVREAKKALRRLDKTLNGGIVLCGPVPMSAHVQLCEGIETGLSVGMATARPVVACTTAQLLDNWVPFQGTRYVTVWADTGKAGQTHARNLKARLEKTGISCRLIFPWDERAGQERDWNDILVLEGEDAIRAAYAGDCSRCTYE